ncbi:hypothetical protein [Devosia nitrariae]|uniref:Response regulatory domain-containing protein n=1 Tax=Devosia nitrariae TaxID=2071872 RepID=A0ABQ5W942_9HYPH|nr:hypothetical protein [Devosia nitrariae]GLQ56630.1 hypothetical protein GCM10010862_38890 [Devosia nitrariae]
MANGRILIVAPEIDLRRSLRFALEAEGYAVTDLPHIKIPPPDLRYDCTVLDRKAAVGPQADIVDFCRRSDPVILLSEVGIPWLADSIAAVVERPVAGFSLVKAIAKATASPAAATTT